MKSRKARLREAQRDAPDRCPQRHPLPALWDAAFDKGLVSFADDGTALLSPREAARTALAADRAGLRPEHRANLALHRARYGL
jgi:hypothetical protein